MARTLRATKPLLAAGALAAAFAFAPANADAQSVFFSGWTNGCFNCAAPDPAWTSNGQQDAQLGTLQFYNSTFSGITFMGGLGMGDNAVDQNGAKVLNVNNFGAFYLDYSTAVQNYNGQTFTLFIHFVDPISHGEVFSASMSGAVQASTGGVTINFSNEPVWFGPNNQFSVTVNDVSLNAPPVGGRRQAPVTGALTATSDVVPEPITMMLMGTGLLGVGVAARRRRKLEQADIV